MAITAKGTSTKDFIPAPAGVHSAVCCDVVDMGTVEVTYPGKPARKIHAIRIVWQIEELMEDGKPFIVQRRYNNSLHEKAALRKDLESWRGRSFTDSELEGFDLENLLSIPCMLSVIHATKQEKVYANVSSVMKLHKGMVPLQVRDYVRVCDRVEDAPQGSSQEIDDSDVPF